LSKVLIGGVKDAIGTTNFTYPRYGTPKGRKDWPLLLQRLRSVKLICNELFVTASTLTQPSCLVSTYNRSALTVFLQINHAPPLLS